MTSMQQHQVQDDDLPTTEHNFPVDRIATPREMFRAETVSPHCVVSGGMTSPGKMR
ncbi:MAG: hypothetical protein J2P57_22595 [Acidimicrobiaceae bacterium]|nr:hypothetical protein [Acidimicrobiaceae bacterium]